MLDCSCGMKRLKRQHRHKRNGAIAVLAALLLVVMMAFMAFAIDLGYLYTVRCQMQRAADSAAIAACWELVDQNAVKGVTGATTLAANATTKAGQFVGYNLITESAATLGSDDVGVGNIANPTDPTSPFTALTSSSGPPNAVQISVRRTSQQNGAVPLFFARVIGTDSATLQSDATAAFISSIGGFKAPSDGSNMQILPFALDSDTWNDLLNGGGSDNFSYDPSGKTVSGGSDGIREVNLYPQGTGSPGNRGTVDIGGQNNSTQDLSRQIVDGISPSDFAQLPNGRLEFDSSGNLALNGDTGISAGVKDELASITGQARMVPVFANVAGNGNNANYTINKFVGVRIMEVKLTGNKKRVMVQPAVVVSRGLLPSSTSKSDYIFSPVWLVR